MLKDNLVNQSKFIVTTTINSPTKATKLFSEKKDWNLIVVGDLKTPHDQYKDIRCTYLSPEYQKDNYPLLSEAIGWNSIQRRNIGFIEAFKLGADIVATVDDDNIPYESWGQNLYVNKEVEVDTYETGCSVFDPLSVTNHNYLWHRGFPVSLLSERLKVEYKGKQFRKVLVQADLWDGDPDIDAMARLSFSPCVKFDNIEPYCSNKVSPFNSQNTFLSREVLPYYSVLPHIGRMDDIWGAYLMQAYFPGSVIYSSATVYQDRNPQDLITNLENEILGYRNTIKFVSDPKSQITMLPEKTQKFWELYRNEYINS